MTAPEPEYIITGEDISCLSDYIEAALVGDESKTRLRELFNQQFSVMRSRPYSPAPHTPVVCLCGSTRFTREMLIKQWELTKQGYIILSWCALPDDYYQCEEKAHIGDQEGVKEFVDEIHKRKIDIADEVLVIDIGGYIGTSTRSEINYALSKNKPVKYLSESLRAGEK